MGKTVFKVTEEMKQQIIILYNQGKLDKEIAQIIGNITDGTVFYWRKKLGLKTKFDYSQVSKIDNNKFEKLFKDGLSDYAIAKILKMTPDGVYSHRMRHRYFRESLKINKPKQLSQFQREVLIGTMLGDSSMRIGAGINPIVTCAHGLKQKEYCEYKTTIFQNLGAICKYHKRNKSDKRNGIYYEDYTMYIPANPELLESYKLFYINNKKVIPTELFSDFTKVSLAFMYMDDGSKVGKHGYCIATNCFSLNELSMFKKMLKDKFDLDTTIQKRHILYIKTNSQKLFEHLIKPYLCNCMKYKLHCVS